MTAPNGWTSELGVLKVAAPCRASWDAMVGSDVKRFCTRCHLNVYNLSGLSTDEARALLKENEGRLCVRFYARADGTVLTQDCPVGLATRLKRRVLGGAAAAMALVFGLFELAGLHHAEPANGPAPIAHAPKPPPPEAVAPKPPDESWMEQRRSMLGEREHPREQVMMGRMHLSIQTLKQTDKIEVIKAGP